MHCIWDKSGSKKSPLDAVVEKKGAVAYMRDRAMEKCEEMGFKGTETRQRGRRLVAKSGDLVTPLLPASASFSKQKYYPLHKS